MMDREYADKKLQVFKERLDSFMKSKHHHVEEVHRLRTTTRELYSMLDGLDENRPKLKRIIKLSNEIRDIDVFLKSLWILFP